MNEKAEVIATLIINDSYYMIAVVNGEHTVVPVEGDILEYFSTSEDVYIKSMGDNLDFDGDMIVTTTSKDESVSVTFIALDGLFIDVEDEDAEDEEDSTHEGTGTLQ
jgi:hypothetical protein